MRPEYLGWAALAVASFYLGVWLLKTHLTALFWKWRTDRAKDERIKLLTQLNEQLKKEIVQADKLAALSERERRRLYQIIKDGVTCPACNTDVPGEDLEKEMEEDEPELPDQV